MIRETNNMATGSEGKKDEAETRREKIAVRK